MKAVINLDVPGWQIGQNVTVYFPDSMVKCGECELLKEQEAVEPIITPWLENEDGEIIVAKRECGRCGYQFFTEKPNYCENCGVPILWESR